MLLNEALQQRNDAVIARHCVEGYDGPQPTALFDYQAVLREERWSPNSIQLVIGIVCLAIGAAWLGGFPGFLIAVGFILIAGIALKH
jgi:hypothetical protein